MNFTSCQGGAMPCHITKREIMEHRTRVILNSISTRPEPAREPLAISSRSLSKGAWLTELYGPFQGGAE
jgi:hypothetical protein